MARLALPKSLRRVRSVGLGPSPTGPAGPTITISGVTVPSGAGAGTAIATLGVANGTGTFTFTKPLDPDGKLTLSGSNLTLAAGVDYNSKVAHTFRIAATNGAGTNLTLDLTLLVIPTLAALTLSAPTATIGSPFTATILGKTAGSRVVFTGSPGGLSISGATASGTPTGTGTFGLYEDSVPLAPNNGRTSNGVLTISAGAPALPANTAVPTITGTPTIGDALVLGMGGWSNGPITSYAYTLSAGGTTVASGTTTSTTVPYTPLGSDVGKTLSLSVVASNASGAATAPGVSATSAAIVAMTTPTLPYLRAVNLGGAESGGSIYAFPDLNTVDYFMARGVNAFRLPFRAERFQPIPGGPIAQPYASRLKQVTDYIVSKGAYFVLDPHNSCLFQVGATIDDQNVTGGTQVVRGQDASYTNSHYADFYSKLTGYFAHRQAIFAFDNEPHAANGGDLPLTPLVASINAAIAAVRANGLKNLITWNLNGYGLNGWGDASANWGAVSSISDSGSNNAMEGHFYLDQYGPGQSTTVDPAQLSTVLPNFTAHARSVGLKVFIGEVGFGPDATSLAAGQTAIFHFENNRDVYTVGHAYWYAVAYQDSYIYQILPTERTNAALGNPISGSTTDRAQIAIMAPVWEAPAGYKTTTLDPANKRASVALSGGNLIAGLTSGANADANWPLVRSVASSSGLLAVEFTISTANASQGVGIVPASADVTTAGTTRLSDIAGAVVFRGDGAIVQNNAQIGSFAADASNLPIGTKILLVVDLVQGKLWATHSGVTAWNNSGANPASGTGGISFSVTPGAYHAAIEAYYFAITANFGAAPFHKAVPATFLRLVEPQVSSGLPEAPNGFAYLLGTDGAYLTGADAALLYGVAA